MKKKAFKSRLFNRKLPENEKDYWIYLYADVLFRLKQLEELNCPRGKCFDEKRNYNWLIKSLIKDNHIKENPKPINFTGKGDCGRAQKKVTLRPKPQGLVLTENLGEDFLLTTFQNNKISISLKSFFWFAQNLQLASDKNKHRLAG